MLSALMASLRASLQAKKLESIPLRAGHMPGHSAQRFVYALLIAKPFLQHLYGYALLFELAGQQGSCRGQSGIPAIVSPLSCRPGQLLQKRLRRPNPEFGLLGEGQGPLTGPLRQFAFGIGLETPGDAPHQELLVVGSRLLAQHFAVLYLQLANV